MLLSAVIILNPIGLDFLRSAFFASEQLARSIARPIVLMAMATMALVVVIEWLVRLFFFKRRARVATTV